MSTAALNMDDKAAALKRETVRNRMNQRAFRSRRQEYVRELEEQVRTFQREGVRATQEVQMAARIVASENALLRRFVKAYAKCDDRDIDMLLVHMRGDSSDMPNNFSIPTVAGHHGQEPVMSVLSNMPSDQLNSCRRQSKTSAENPNSTVLRPVEIRPISRCSSTPTNTVDLVAATDAAPSQGCEQARKDQTSPLVVCEHMTIVPEHSSRQITPPQALPSYKGPGDSISCEEAASIIAGLRMRNADDAREELGCQSQDSCHIKNIALLQLMNETF